MAPLSVQYIILGTRSLILVFSNNLATFFRKYWLAETPPAIITWFTLTFFNAKLNFLINSSMATVWKDDAKSSLFIILPL